MSEETQVFVELTQYTLHALRAVKGRVEAGGECALENKAAIEALLDAVAPARKTEGLHAAATVWPASTLWYLATDTEAMLDRTGDALRAIAAGRQKDPAAALAYAACNAGDGGKVTPDGIDKWLMAFTALGSLEKASSGLLELKVDPIDVTPSAFSGIGAIAAALAKEGAGRSVALWDLGAEGSHILLVTAKGAEAVVPCSVGMDAIIEAVQTAPEAQVPRRRRAALLQRHATTSRTRAPGSAPLSARASRRPSPSSRTPRAPRRSRASA